MKYIDAEKLNELVKEWRSKQMGFAWDAVNEVLKIITSLQQEQPNNMIQWTGNNLKEVIDFTGKSPRFGEWFNSWEDFENYVHSHDDILKLFCEDGGHYEVPVGAWIVKTPDGYNTPSSFRFIQKPTEWSEEDDACYELILEELEHYKESQLDYSRHFSRLIEWFTHRFKSLCPQPKQEQPEVDLVTEYDEQFYSDPVFGRLVNRNAGIAIARHFYELGLNARKEENK